jgi:hypothetical protein
MDSKPSLVINDFQSTNNNNQSTGLVFVDAFPDACPLIIGARWIFVTG